MKRNFIILLTLCVLCCASLLTSAQSTGLPGKIVDETGVPIAQASISLKGKTGGVISKDNGEFVISSTGKGTLVISAVGYETREINIDGLQRLDVTLKKSDTQLESVVVTAYGIRREKNTLPYAAQQISGDDVNKTRIGNVASGLSGKISGLQITQGNGIGGSVNVVIRGAKSLTGNNQAMFVIDGVPIDNSTNNSNGQRAGTGGYDYGNAAGDINPDDIQSINVLKGAAATALYGSRAANGVIMITTKKAKSGFNLTLNSGVIVGTVDKTTYIKYQTQYGAGRSTPLDQDGFYLGDVDGDGIKDLIAPTEAVRSWGPKFDPNLMVYHWDAFDPTSPYYKKKKPWVAPANGPVTFFENSLSTNNSVFMDATNDKGFFKIGYTRNEEKGIVPNSRVIKNIVNFAASYKITDKLTASALVNYSKVDGKGRYGTGYDGGRNINITLRQFGQTNWDMLEQRDAYLRTGKNITWNWADPRIASGIRPAFYNNAYWTVYQNYETDTRTRTFGNVALNYAATDWLNLMARISVDNYNELQEERNAAGSIGVSSYSRVNRSYNETNYDLLATVNKDISDDFKFSGLAGVNLRKNTLSSISASTSGGLIVPGLYYISNSLGTVSAPNENYSQRAVDGYFGGVTFSYRDFLTLDATIRNDRSSTLPKGFNSYVYHAISGSWVFSKHLQKLSWLSSGKLRANYATVGNDAPPLSLSDVYDQPTPVGSSILFSLPSTKNNSNLRPEKTTSKEIGLEMSFLRNRVGFDVTYYHTNTVDQIFPVAVSTSTGYSSKYINAGNIENKGIELSMFGSPVNNRNFSWNINVNFTRNRNKVIALYDNSQNLLIASFQGGVTLNATLGRPYGELQSNTFQFLNGQRLVNANGLYPTSTTTNNLIGNVNPDWIGGLMNSFRYKNLTVSFLVDVRNGGKVFSLDMYYGQNGGFLPESVGLNDLGNDKRLPVAQGGGVILPGVTADGKENTKRVTIVSSTSTVLPQSEFVYDASYVKLREANITYTLSSKVLSGVKKYIKGVDISLIGRNLWLIHSNVPYADPEENFSAGNVQGYQSGAYPTSRNIGVNLKVKF
jgi:TonB-linked SusC/RagA family outer membrane protein